MGRRGDYAGRRRSVHSAYFQPPLRSECIYLTSLRGATISSHLCPPPESLDGLKVLALLITHGHMDHSEGCPEIFERFPEASIITDYFTKHVIEWGTESVFCWIVKRGRVFLAAISSNTMRTLLVARYAKRQGREVFDGTSLGAEIIRDSTFHASGHPKQGDIKRVLGELGAFQGVLRRTAVPDPEVLPITVPGHADEEKRRAAADLIESWGGRAALAGDGEVIELRGLRRASLLFVVFVVK